MEDEGGLNIEVKDCRSETLVDLYYLLKGEPGSKQKIEIQRELLKRRRESEPITDQQLVDILVHGVPKKGRAEIAREWSKAFGITEKEFMEMANG